MVSFVNESALDFEAQLIKKVRGQAIRSRWERYCGREGCRTDDAQGATGNQYRGVQD